MTSNEPTPSNHERAPNAYNASPSTTPAPRTKSAVDLYDVPLSDDEDPPLMRKNVTKSAQRVKIKSAMFDALPSDEEGQSTMRRKFPKLKQKALQKSSVYDMSLSEDEMPPSARKNPSKLLPKANENPTTTPRAKHSNITASTNNDSDGMPERKKRKLSPVEQPRRVPAKLPVVPPKVPPNSQNKKAQSISNALPKRLAVHAKPISHSDLKQSTPHAPKRHMPPKAAELRDALLDKDHGTEGTASTSGDELSLVITKPKKPYPMARKLPKSTAVAKPTSIIPRKRLIDSLVKQAPHQDSDEEDDDDDDDNDDDDESGNEHDNSQLENHFQHLHNSRAQSLTPDLPTFTTSAQASQGSQITGPKFTYSRQRSMLVEEDVMEQLAFDMPLETPQGSQRRRGSIPSLKPLLSFREDEEGEDEAANTTIRSIHELRQAGANSRFADEVEDLLDRIGAPTAKTSSMRRSGLLDLGIKMKDKTFVRQFRAHGAEQRLFVGIGEEIDVVSGFLMISLVTPILAEGSVPLVVSQLQEQGISKLLNRLISVEKSIISVTKERKTNMSKMAQNSISAYHDFLLAISAWKDLSPVELSPRTLALKCLELMVRQSREAGDASDIISEELNTSLFEILTSSDGDASWDLPSGKEAIDFYLTLSTLESHSLVARTAQDETIWLRQLLPIIGNTLNTALNRPLDSFGEQQILALKLTLNVTNHNPKACDAIANSDLMYTILRVVVAKFKRLSNLWAEEEIIVAVDNLILLIGAMINFALWTDDEISPNEEGCNPHVTVTKQLEDLVKKLLAIKGANTRSVQREDLAIYPRYGCLGMGEEGFRKI
ncbi:hypothetical protein SS1G_00189 [Sclerotinia sclerotiorum 1980 UF-70]|uniref:Wings apart-like protein C-terminal domain-containing protein n=1 Tax=Sclerotinia sclerotiorum (strain ATCC 18683 / 1980 / Ss-1) TaxID=665079 RepID=A7E4G7_SCLS1|nr:hypothetical protein SS1G_00189 [Sclerotinia sclerotiorum 1980 UF-70]EDN90789.1 hypothetical protein SS1G_00189 [Sclerotinia sclerotiorum 1980 UF-70]